MMIKKSNDVSRSDELDEWKIVDIYVHDYTT